METWSSTPCSLPAVAPRGGQPGQPPSGSVPSVDAMAIDWTEHLLEQLTWHWDSFVRPHLDGLTDDEYLWEPVPGCWSVRRRGAGWFVERTHPAPTPPPVTTIAWRLAHLV